MAVKTDTYGVDFVFNAQDAVKTTNRMATATGRATDKLKEMVTQKGYLLYSLKRIASYSAIFSFFGALIKMLGNVIQLELRLAEVNTLIDKTNQDAVDSYNQVTAALLQLDPHLGNAIDLTKGLYEIISAGVTDPAQAFELLQVAAKYAKVGLTDLATAASSLTGVMKAYGFTSDKMRAKSDILFAAVREGKFHTDELNEAIGKVLPTAAAMNVSVEEISAALAIMTQRGLDVNEASTSLNRMLISFLRPMDKAQKQFSKLGWTWGRNAFEGIGLIGAMKRLEEASKRYGDLLPQIFRRQRALRGAFILQGAGLLDLEEMYGRITDATLGGGIVAREYGLITKTVSEEMKALYANMIQAFAALMQHKGTMSYFIRELSNLLRMIVENVPALLGFVTAIVLVKKAILALNLALGQSVVLWGLKIRWMIRGATAANAAAIAQRNLAFATGTVAASLGLLTSALTVAAVAYLLIKGTLDSWNDSLEAQRQAIMDDAVELKEYYDRMKAIAAIYEELTGKTLEYNQIIKARARVSVWDRLRKDIQSFKTDLPKVTRAIEGVFEEATLSTWEYRKEIKALASFFTGEGFFRREDLDAIEDVFNIIALRLGFLKKEAIDFTNNAAKGVDGMAEAIRKMDDDVLRMARDLRMAGGELKSLPGDLARRFTKEEIEDMLKAVERLSEGLDKEMIDKLKYFGVDSEKLAKDSLQLEHFKGAAEEALSIWDKIKADQRIEDYQRTFESSFRKIIYTTQQAEETAMAFYKAWMAFPEKTPAAMKIVATAHRKEIEKIIATAENLPPRVKQLLEEMMAHWDKSTDKLVKIREKYKKISEKSADDLKKIESKIAQFQNEYNAERHKNVVEQFKRESIAYENRAAERLDLAMKSGADLLTAQLAYVKSMLKIQEWGQEAGKVSQYRALKERLAEFTKTLNHMNQNTQQRIDTTYKMEEAATQFLKDMGIADEDFMKWLAEIIHRHFEQIRTDTEAGRDVMQEYIKSLRSLSTALALISTTFADLAEGMGQEQGALRDLAHLFDILSTAVDGFAKGLKSIKDAEALTGLSAMAGKAAGVAAILLSAFKVGWELGKFIKGLFGGDTRTADEKAAEAAIKKMEKYIAQLKVQLADLGKVSDEMSQKIYELVQEGIPEYLALSMNLVDLMNDTGISVKNFEAYITRMIEALGYGTDAMWSMEEAAEVVGEAFNKIIEYAKKMGLEGSKALLDFMKRAEELGYVIEELNAYRIGELTKAAEGLAKAILWVAQDAVDAWSAMKDLNKERRKLMNEMARWQARMDAAKEGSEAWEKARDRVEELYNEILKLDKELAKHQGTLNSVGTATVKQLTRLGIIAAAVFDGMWAQGVSMFEIFEKMGDAVFALMDRYKALGMEVPKYLQRIFKQFRAFRKHPEIFEGLQGLQQALEGLANSGYLTQDAFKAIYQEANRYFKLLTRAKSEGGLGLGDKEAIGMMYPLLQRMWWYAQQYDLKLPKSIRDLINQAKDLGFKFEKPVLERQLDAISRLNDRMVWHRKGLMEKFRETNRWLEKIYNKPSQQHGTASAAGGFSYLHRGEAVLPENMTSALKRFFVGGGDIGGDSGSGMLEAHIYIDGEKTYKALVPHIRKGGAYADFEVDGVGVR